MFRKILFWIHLVSGVVSGVVIAIMSATGIAIAFEHEILDWIDRDARSVVKRVEPLPLSELKGILAEERPEFKLSSIVVPQSAIEAYTAKAGRSGTVFIDQYTGEVRDPVSGFAHDFLHMLIEWHRWLGREGESRDTGRLITGASNLAFLLLCLTGLYLWFPKVMKWRLFKSVLFLKPSSKGKARDFNWHNVFGIWSLPVLTVLVATAVVISFPWAHKLVYAMAGEEPPVRRGPPGQSARSVDYEAPDSAKLPIPLDAAVQSARKAYPEAKHVEVVFPRRTSDKTSSGSVSAINLKVQQPTLFPSRGSRDLVIDPYRAIILQDSGFENRTTGTKARIWIRFLHTGEAFGIWGKIIASIASAAALLLVYTGFALSWRRFFGKRKRATPSDWRS